MSQYPAQDGLHLGLDLVQVARIEESLARFGARFLERVYTPAEIAYCQSAPREQARRYAARFAAKEATWKALGLDDTGHEWRAIEVVHDAQQAPSVVLHEPLRSRAEATGARPLSISITHEADYAAAVVLASRSTQARPSDERPTAHRPRPV